MATPTPEPGAIFWSIAPSIEANHDRAVRPWRGKVVRIVEGGSKFCAIYLSRFDPTTGEPDRDPNATAIVKVGQLYGSEREALEGYLAAVLDARDEVTRELAWITDQRGRLREEERLT